MGNTILPFVLPLGRKGSQMEKFDLNSVLASSSTLLDEVLKADLLWTVIRQQPTTGLFTIDKRTLQVIQVSGCV